MNNLFVIVLEWIDTYHQNITGTELWYFMEEKCDV